MEPAALSRGKAFHRRVQMDWERTANGGQIYVEYTLSLLRASAAHHRVRRGRLDIFVDDDGDFVSVIEIKATDWDHVRPQNRRKLMSSHRRQVWRYIEKFVDGDHTDVCAGIIYLAAPSAPGLREDVETYLNEYALQVVWYDD